MTYIHRQMVECIYNIVFIVLFFPALTPHISTTDNKSRLHFMILFGTCFKFLEANTKTSKAVYVCAFDAIKELAKVCLAFLKFNLESESSKAKASIGLN